MMPCEKMVVTVLLHRPPSRCSLLHIRAYAHSPAQATARTYTHSYTLALVQYERSHACTHAKSCFTGSMQRRGSEKYLRTAENSTCRRSCINIQSVKQWELAKKYAAQAVAIFFYLPFVSRCVKCDARGGTNE